MKKQYIVFIIWLSYLTGAFAQTPIDFFRQDDGVYSILNDPQYEVQIRYTRIIRDEQQNPTFVTYTWPVYNQTPSYFYPASTVKIVLCALALEKIYDLNHNERFQITRDMAYRMAAVDGRPAYKEEPTSMNGLPSIGQDIRLVLTISDNAAFNRLLDFVGVEHTAARLKELGYTCTSIVHRLGDPGSKTAVRPAIAFVKDKEVVYGQRSSVDNVPLSYAENMPGHIKGIGYVNEAGFTVEQSFDFSNKNCFCQADQELFLKQIIFPDALPRRSRFKLTQDDFEFLRYWMSILPRESQSPALSEAEYHDSYGKYLMYGDTKDYIPHYPRIYNKVGEAYGTISDMAYICDPERGVEFMLCVTILCNSDGIFNDDKYDYDTIGLPFMAKIGQMAFEWELSRRPTVRPKLHNITFDYRRWR